MIIFFVASGDQLEKAYNSIVDIITDSQWKIQEKEDTILGIEHAGMHMTLKKLIQHDKINLDKGYKTFGHSLVQKLSNELVCKIPFHY